MSFDRRVAAQVLGWSVVNDSEVTGSSPATRTRSPFMVEVRSLPDFGDEDFAAVAALRAAIPDRDVSELLRSYLGVELSAVGSAGWLEGLPAHSAPAWDSDMPEAPEEVPRVRWYGLAKGESVRNRLRMAVEEKRTGAVPRPEFSPNAVAGLAACLGEVRRLVDEHHLRCAFTLRWTPEQTWLATLAMVPGTIRQAVVAGSPLAAVALALCKVIRGVADQLEAGRQASPAQVCPPTGVNAGFPELPSAESLREWREGRGLTQAQAGELVGAGRRTWQSWELGTRTPPRMLVFALRALGRSSDD